jgi:hypothetical protein
MKGWILMDCCQCQGIKARFDDKYVAKRVKKYRKEGPKKTAWQLIEALQAEGIAAMTLLDIGGGIGDLQHELIRAGVAYAIDSEASAAYVEACCQEAERLGHADRIRHVVGNFVDVAEDIEPADIVTLDRVICCYHDMPGLINLSIQKAKRLYGLVFPIDKWWTRLGSQLYYNFPNWLKRNPMRMFVHSPEAMDAIIRGNGFERRFHRVMGRWQVAVYARA